MGGHEKIVALLLDKGATVNALQAASERDHEKVVELLLDKVAASGPWAWALMGHCKKLA